MKLLGVVPGEEPLAERLGVLVGPEPRREVGPVLEGLELGLGEGVVIGDVGPGGRGHHAQRAIQLTAVAAIVAVAVTLVAFSLRQPEVPTYSPTPPSPRDAGHTLVGPVLYTVDATNPEQWRYFSFHVGSVIENAGAKDWDLAFRRYQIIANGGREFVGGAGIVDLGEVAFADVKTVPDAGYLATEGGTDPRNPAIASWYSYSYFSHVLSPKPHVWAVRTADGGYAKIELVSYYCPRSQPGCLTFRYVYQGDGSRVVGGN